jgi:hypothetical protein
MPKPVRKTVEIRLFLGNSSNFMVLSGNYAQAKNLSTGVAGFYASEPVYGHQFRLCCGVEEGNNG